MPELLRRIAIEADPNGNPFLSGSGCPAPIDRTRGFSLDGGRLEQGVPPPLNRSLEVEET